jgi:flagellar motor switch/type III secretory pathway protein FliN
MLLSRFWSSFCFLSQSMATTEVLTPPTGASAAGATAEGAEASVDEQALVPVSTAPEDEGEMTLSTPVARLPVELDVAVPVRDFRVRNLLNLERGQIIESRWANGEDMPLSSGEVQLAWSEFEVVDTQLAVRVTRLA